MKLIQSIQNFYISNNALNTPLKINSTIITTDLIEEKNGLVYLKIGKVIGLQSNLFEDSKRVNPIEINFTNSYNYKIEVEIPKGYRVLDFSELNRFKEYVSVNGNSTAKFFSTANIEGNKITVSIEEFYKELRYSKNRYIEFRQVINAAAKFYESKIIL